MTDACSRRDLLTGTFIPAANELPPHEPGYISSAIVSVLPARRSEVIARLANLPGAEVHHSNTSKLVVVLEGPGSGALGAMLADISGWSGVLSANMVFEQRLDQEHAQ